MMDSLVGRHQDKIAGVLCCWDRVVIQGTLPGLCYAAGMTSYLKTNDIRVFDYPRFAEPLRDLIRENAENLAKKSGVEIEFVRKSTHRKEARIKEVLAKRGAQPGLVHVLSAMEACPSYRPWYDKQTGETFLKPTSGKCLHYYFYFIDKDLGLCYLRSCVQRSGVSRQPGNATPRGPVSGETLGAVRGVQPSEINDLIAEG
jgi:hypothetical protein